MPVIEGVEMPVQQTISNMKLYVETKWFHGANNIPNYLVRKFDDIGALKDKLFERGEKFDALDEWFLAALGRREYMFHFLTTNSSKPCIFGDFDEEIYYGKETTPLQFYTDSGFIEKTKEDFARF